MCRMVHYSPPAILPVTVMFHSYLNLLKLCFSWILCNLWERKVLRWHSMLTPHRPPTNKASAHIDCSSPLLLGKQMETVQPHCSSMENERQNIATWREITELISDASSVFDCHPVVFSYDYATKL